MPCDVGMFNLFVKSIKGIDTPHTLLYFIPHKVADVYNNKFNKSISQINV